jgi:hypothetical protein
MVKISPYESLAEIVLFSINPSLLEAVQKIKSMTGVDHFYFISD